MLSLVPVACSDDAKQTGVQQQEAIGIDEGDVGTCLRFGEDVGPDVVDLPVIDCAESHSHEIYAVIEQPKDDVYPGFDALEDAARVGCLDPFEDYVQRGAFDSDLLYTWIVPSIESWNDKELEDRKILCVLGDRNNAPLTGSMRHADR